MKSRDRSVAIDARRIVGYRRVFGGGKNRGARLEPNIVAYKSETITRRSRSAESYHRCFGREIESSLADMKTTLLTATVTEDATLPSAVAASPVSTVVRRNIGNSDVIVIQPEPRRREKSAGLVH